MSYFSRPTRRFRSQLSVAALAACSFFGVVEAASTLNVSVSMTIDATISVNWCDSAGANDSTAAQTWQLGSSITLNTTYQTIGTTYGTIPVLRYLENNSDVIVDVAVQSGSSANWAVSSGNGVNVFAIKITKNNGTNWSNTDTPYGDYFNNLSMTGRTAEIGLQLITPTSVTAGIGVQQTSTTVFTASTDNGD